MDWFKKLYPEVPPEFPPALRFRLGKTYRITFKEKRPRLVMGGFNKATAVINVEYQGESRSLFVGSNVDLGRQVSAIEKKRGSLEGVTVEIIKTEKRGRNWIYKVVEI